MTCRTLYLARHGETDWNAERRWQGQTDTPLNAAGRADAKALAARMSGRGITRIHASDLARAKETAEIVASHLGVAAVICDPDLRERRFGVFEGLTFEECMSHHPEAWARYRADRTCLPDGAETDAELACRVGRGIETIMSGQGTALLVGHGSAIRVYLTSVGQALALGDFGLPNGAAVEVTIGSDGRIDVAPLDPLL